MSQAVVTLDDAGLSTLHQVALGLLADDALPPADVYTDAEGTPVATRHGNVVTLSKPAPWPHPDQVRTSRPVVVAVANALPAADVTNVDAVLLLPSGGVRPDDHRHATWASAWRSITDTVIETPVQPQQATERHEQLARAYSDGPLLTVSTRPLPPPTGRVVFFTGLSGSGKSTIARELTKRLAADRTVTLLDGDVVRTHLSKGLGFSREDRDTNIRRIGWVAAEVAKHGGFAVCAPIAPYDATRRWVRDTVEGAAGQGSFLLIHVSTPLDVCEKRDTKGLYAKARAGELSGFTGIDDPYETPQDAQLAVDTSIVSLADAVEQVLALLRP